MTNCEECKYHWNNACGIIRANSNCYECDNFDNDSLECKCTSWLGEDEENDCPHFERYYDAEQEETL